MAQTRTAVIGLEQRKPFGAFVGNDPYEARFFAALTGQELLLQALASADRKTRYVNHDDTGCDPLSEI